MNSRASETNFKPVHHKYTNWDEFFEKPQITHKKIFLSSNEVDFQEKLLTI